MIESGRVQGIYVFSDWTARVEWNPAAIPPIAFGMKALPVTSRPEAGGAVAHAASRVKIVVEPLPIRPVQELSPRPYRFEPLSRGQNPCRKQKPYYLAVSRGTS